MIEHMIEWDRHRLDRRYFSSVGIHGIQERAPGRCPTGHRLGPDTMLIGAYPCLCAGHPHRLWLCIECAAVLVRPPCVHHPEWVGWLG